jgi:transposase
LTVNYCGIDIAGVSSYVYVIDAQGKKRWSGPVATAQVALTGRLKRFVRGGLRVAIEAGNQTAWIYEALVELGAEVTVVNPNKVKLIAESRRKTDKVDAKVLCELLRLDGLPQPVHMPGRETRALRGLLVARRQLVAARTKLCNVVRGMLRQEGIRLPARALSSYVGWKRIFHAGFEHDHLLTIVWSYYNTFVSLTKSIRQIEGQLAQAELKDPRAARLQTMPRVGRIASLTFLAAVDDVGRFPSSRKIVSYSGLAPTVRSSGERTEYGSITRQGRSELRAVWVQVAHGVANDARRAAQPLRSWFNRVAKRRGKKTATVALARRLLVIAYHLLRDETDYDVGRLRRRRAA